MKAASNKAAEDTLAAMISHGMIEDFPIHEPEFDKLAGARCQHQRHHKGCAIYRTRPFGCRMWSCAFLQGEDLPRPDRCGYVVDTIPDTIRLTDDEGIEPPQELMVAQVWVDRARPDAHRDKRLRDWLDKKGVAALVRFNEHDGMAIFPPSVTGKDHWVERRSGRIDNTLGIHGRIEQIWPSS
jgi:hypothetical protein